jgi:hypothetical protein
MRTAYQESAFAGLLVVAAGLALGTYMLGVLLDPRWAAGGSLVLVAVGVTVFVPAGLRLIGASIGIFAVLLAGVFIPRIIAGFTTIPNEMPVTLAVSGFVLVVAVIALRFAVYNHAATHTSAG